MAKAVALVGHNLIISRKRAFIQLFLVATGYSTGLSK